MSPRVSLFGIDIDNLSMEGSLAAFDELIKSGLRHYVVTPNVDHIIRLQRDKEFKKAYDGASLTLADGMPLIWASRMLGNGLKERVAGSDFFPEICRMAAKKGYSIFLLGGREAVADIAGDILKKTFPNLIIAGTHHGYIMESDTDDVVDTINAVSPNILFLGMGSPRQELWVMRHLSKLSINVALGVGGSFDIIAGVRARAPRWMQRNGLEWCYRLLQEPKRLWKRYLVDDIAFIWIFMKEIRKVQNSDR